MNDIYCRQFDEDMVEKLAESLKNDPYHQNTTVEFFKRPGTGCNVYEDEAGPIAVVRGSNVLRLDVQFMDNDDIKRNLRLLLNEFPKVCREAKAQGVHEVCFNTSNPVLKKFAIKRLGMEVVEGDELRVIL